MTAESIASLQPADSMGSEAAEKFRRREHDQVCFGKTKSTCEGPFDQIDLIERCIFFSDDFAKPLDLAFRLKIDDYPGVFCLPFSEAIDELRSLGLRQHEVSDGKLADAAILECALKIFRALFDPTLADLNRAAGFARSFDRNLEMIRRDVIANFSGLVV